MSDAKQRPDAIPHTHPKSETGEDKGPIKGPQRTADNTPVTDTPRGSEVETRNSSNRRG